MEFKNQRPIYQQIGDYIMENVLSGKWEGGQRIPSVRELAAEVEVNPNTVVRTYNFLLQESIVFNRRGVGYFLEEDARQKVVTFKRKRFMEEDLPILFKNMDLLQINFNELQMLYQKITRNENQ